MLIPYSEVCKLVESAKKTEELESEIQALHTQLDALRTMYFELLEKFAELRKML